MATAEDANLILKLYELRREPLLREARAWYMAHFHPSSVEEVMAMAMGEDSAKMRMVVSYWDMAAALVNHGALDEALFNEANGEHLAVFSRFQPYLAELRQRFNTPQAFQNLERLIMRIPDGEARLQGMRDRSAAARQARTTAN